MIENTCRRSKNSFFFFLFNIYLSDPFPPFFSECILFSSFDPFSSFSFPSGLVFHIFLLPFFLTSGLLFFFTLLFQSSLYEDDDGDRFFLKKKKKKHNLSFYVPCLSKTWVIVALQNILFLVTLVMMFNIE